MCLSVDEDKNEVQQFYHQLYTSQGFHELEPLLQHVPLKVTPDMNLALTKPYDLAKVKTVLFQMDPSKAPGVDGFTTGFYQRHWELLKDDVTQAVLDFLNGGELPAGLNDTS